MSEFTDKRTNVQARITSLTQELREQLARAGREIVASGALPDEEPYTSLTSQEAKLSKKIADLGTTKDRIVSIGERLAEIDSKRDELDARRKEIGGALESHYQTVGEHSFRVFRDNPLIDQEYADIFTPVLNAYEDIRQVRGELQIAEGELSEKPFLEKMVVRGRIIVLRNRITTRENHLERLFREAGKQIAATDFITTIGDPALDDAAAPFLELLGEQQQIERELGALNDERAALQGELAALGVERRSAGRISELNEQIGATEAERSEALAAITTAAKGSQVAEQFGAGIATLLDEIGETEAEIESASKKIERLDAAIEVERLSKEVNQLETSIDRKRDQIANLSSEIEDLESRKASVSSEVDRASQQRGPVEDLLS